MTIDMGISVGGPSNVLGGPTIASAGSEAAVPSYLIVYALP